MFEGLVYLLSFFLFGDGNRCAEDRLGCILLLYWKPFSRYGYDPRRYCVCIISLGSAFAFDNDSSVLRMCFLRLRGIGWDGSLTCPVSFLLLI